MEMDLDELRVQWAEHDRKLDAMIGLNRKLLVSLQAKPVRSAIRWLTASLVVEVLFALASVVLLGSFLGDHIAQPKFAVPAAVLAVFAIGFLLNLIRQAVVASQIDYSGPVAAMQKKLETLRVLRIRYTQALLVIAVLAWPPLCIVSFKAFLGLDAYELFGSTYIWVNVLAGLAVIPIAIWLAKKIGDRSSRSPAVRYIVRTISGSSLNAAADALAKISEFETE